jgi:ankyrin repeat protein
MSLLDLPNELLLSIVGNLTRESDINALVQTNRRLYYTLNLFLYRFSVARGNNSALRWAALHGFYPLVQTLLNLGANPRATPRNSSHVTALHMACANGHQSIVEALIQSGADVNAKTTTGITPLHEAIAEGFEGIARILLENGADFMKKLPDKNHSTVLHIASYFGYTNIVQLLLNIGMGIEAKDRLQRTPLHSAIEIDEGGEISWYGNLSTVTLLLRRNANADAWDMMSLRPKDLAKEHPNSIVKILFQSGSDISIEEAIQKEQRTLKRREQEQAIYRKQREIIERRAAKRMERSTNEPVKMERWQFTKTENAAEQDRVERELCTKASILEKHYAIQRRWAKIRLEANEKQLLREMTEAGKQQNHLLLEEEKACVLTTERQDAHRQDWSRMRAEAEERNRRVICTTTTRLHCLHPALGWLKCKGKTQCDICESFCMKYSFQCGDCSVKVCLLCKTNPQTQQSLNTASV